MKNLLAWIGLVALALLCIALLFPEKRNDMLIDATMSKVAVSICVPPASHWQYRQRRIA